MLVSNQGCFRGFHQSDDLSYVTKVTKPLEGKNYLWGSMDLKPYIAIFFATIFFGKFLVMDSQILVTFLDAEEIAYVNPFCEKQNAKKQGATEDSFSEDSHELNLTIDSFCNAPFQFQVYTWASRIISEDSRAYAHYIPSIPVSAIDRFYPPPRA